MSEIKALVNIGYVTDTENQVYSLGEVDGYFDHDVLENYIHYYGSDQLIIHLSRLIAEVIERQRAVNLEKSFEGIGVQCNVDPVNFEDRVGD